jgi:hypothetical protein
MKVLGQSARADKGRLPEPLASLVDTLRRDPEWLKDVQAQDIVVHALNKLLDNHYFLIRNATFEGLELPIPLILIGPPGVWVLYPSALRGIYQAKANEWKVLKDRRQTYVPSRTNLLTRTSLFGTAVETYLGDRGYSQYKIEPVLIFTDPGIHIESDHPSIRIVQIDALDRFVNSLSKSALIISWKESQVLVNILSKETIEEEEESLEPVRDAFSFVEEREPVKLPEISIPLPRDDKVVKVTKKVPLTSHQLLFLGFMIVFNILLLVGFIILILVLS